MGDHLIIYCSNWQQAIYIVGVFSGEGPPVPIPNTEVKLTCAEDTCLETDRENRSTPTQAFSQRNPFFERIPFLFIDLFLYQ